MKRLIEILRGILDESNRSERPIAVHLLAHGAVHSAEEWRRFSDEWYQAKSKRPRCC